MKEIWRICVLVVFLSLKFTKLHGHITDCQCQAIGGIWSPTTKSCFKQFYSYQGKSREDAISFCLNSAPCGSRGRLAHIPNAHIFTYFENCQHCWLGVIAPDGGTQDHFDPKKWVYQDQLRNGTSFTVPLMWHSNKPHVNEDGACMGIWKRQFDDISCNRTHHKPLCEYLSDKYTENIDSGTFSLEETCKQIKGTWSVSTESCFKHYYAANHHKVHLPWKASHSFCMDSAPCGTRGRLAHFPSVSIVSRVSIDKPMWMGVVASTKPEVSTFNASEWELYDEFPNGTLEHKPLHVWLPHVHVNATSLQLCMAISNETYTSDECHKEYTPLCEYLAYDAENMETETCKQIGGAWSEVSKSCFKYYGEKKYTFEQSQLMCMDSAPCESRGRLAHFKSSSDFDLFKHRILSWVGIQATSKPKKYAFKPDIWEWTDILPNGTTVKEPLGWHTPYVHINANDGRCLAVYNQVYDDDICDMARDRICEYVPAEYTRLEVKVCRAISGIWSQSSRSCFKEFSPFEMRWQDSWNLCMETAPANTRGRLAHFQNPDIYNHFQTCHNCWTGLWPVNSSPDDPFNRDQWIWLDKWKNDKIAQVPLEWVNDLIKDDLKNNSDSGMCRVTWYRYMTDVNCRSHQATPVCEYIYDVPIVNTLASLRKPKNPKMTAEVCSKRNGIWVSGRNRGSCFKAYRGLNLTWDDAWSFCMKTASYGNRGRLAHVSSRRAFKKVINCPNCWTAAYAPKAPKAQMFNPFEWFWIDRKVDDGDAKRKFGWQPRFGKTAVKHQYQCLEIGMGRFHNADCSSTKIPICEYLTD